MTPNTSSLGGGLLGLDSASRPRTSQKIGADGFAKVFDAQVRGPRSSSTGEPASAGETPAEKGPARETVREHKPQAREATRKEADNARSDATEPASKRDSAEEETEDGNTLQSSPGEDGKPLPADAPNAQAASTFLGKTAIADGEGIAPDTIVDANGEEAREADLLSIAFTRKTVLEGNTGNAARSADGLLTAFRFNRVMAQERGPLTPALEQGVSAEALNGMTAIAGREGSGVMPSTATSVIGQSISVPLNRAGWDQAFSERVVWMARQGLQEAHIQVTPREMGPIEVRISVQQDQVSVAFAAQNSAARDAIENALPRLREMLAESGLNLAQSDVSQQSPHERGDGRESVGLRGVGRASGEHDDVNAAVQGVTPLAEGRGLVDYFA